MRTSPPPASTIDGKLVQKIPRRFACGTETQDIRRSRLFSNNIVWRDKELFLTYNPILIGPRFCFKDTGKRSNPCLR